ncbi:MAG: hypothetical protein ACOVK9_04385 [Bacteroidia bacterium]|nr:hypothetical protein [Bacteroidota bacterium]
MKKFIVYMALISLITACRKDIAPENPCGNYKNPNADFTMEHTTGERENIGTRFEDYIWYSNPYINKDTLKTIGIIQFRSEFKDTNIYKHTWYIGAEVFHDYKAWRNFNSVTPPAIITIHHVIKWKPNMLCNPNETGYDSMSFRFKVSDRLKDFATFGKYRMVYDTLGAPTNQDSVEVEFYRSKRNLKDSIVIDPKIYDGTDNRIKGLFALSHWPGTGYYVVPSNVFGLDNERFISNTYAFFKNSSTLGTIQIFLNSQKEAFIEYDTYDPNKLNGERKMYKLKGKKLID